MRIWPPLEEAQRPGAGRAVITFSSAAERSSGNTPSTLLPAPNGRDWERSSFSFSLAAHPQGWGSG